MLRHIPPRGFVYNGKLNFPCLWTETKPRVSAVVCILCGQMFSCLCPCGGNRRFLLRVISHTDGRGVDFILHGVYSLLVYFAIIVG